MKKKIIWILFVIILFTGCNRGELHPLIDDSGNIIDEEPIIEGCSDVDYDFITYYSEAGFSIEVPSEWTVNADETGAQFLAPQGEIAFSKYISVYFYSKDDKTFPTIEEYISRKSLPIPGKTMSEIKDMEVNGQLGKIMEFTKPYPDVVELPPIEGLFRSREVLLQGLDGFYLFRFAAPEEEFESNCMFLGNVIDSFQVTIPLEKISHDVDSWDTSEKIVEKFAAHIKQADDLIRIDMAKKYGQDHGYDIKCTSQPSIVEKEFEYLKPKKPLYNLFSNCRLSCIHPSCAVPNWLFYADDSGELIIFETFNAMAEIEYPKAKNMQAYLPELFNDLETEEQLLEYLKISMIPTLDLLDDILTAYSLTKEDCKFDNRAPEVKNVVTEIDNGFIYEGYAIEPEFIIDLYYLKYTVTASGKVTEVERSLVADCGEGIMF